MKYHVIIQPPAVNDLNAAYEYVRQRAPESVKHWFDRFLDAIDSLDHMPRRCPAAPENDLVEPEIRQLLFGKRRNIYRVHFTILGNEVRVLHIRHGARQHMSQGEIEIPPASAASDDDDDD